MTKTDAEDWIDAFEDAHRGALNGFRTLYLSLGVEASPVGLDFTDMDYSGLQGRFETRLAHVLGLHPAVAGLSEGLKGSSLNTANFPAAARQVADTTLHPLWGNACSTLQTIRQPPPGTRLWHDPSQVPFLRSDVKDQAEITNKNGATIGLLIKDGFTPMSAVDAVVTGDMTRLVHTGLVSVQLQPPGTSLPGGQPASFRATREFWPADGPLAAFGVVREGTEVRADDALLAYYPSLFEPVSVSAASSDLATEVRRLRDEGMSVAAIAARLDRTDRHVRRLLTEGGATG